MGRNLLLTNIAQNYSFTESKEFLVKQINDFFTSYTGRTRKVITEVLFIPYAYEGGNENTYIANVIDLFGAIEVKRISVDRPVQDVQAAQAIVIGGGRIDKLESNIMGKLKDTIIAQLGKGIPYIGWNEASIFACQKEIEGLEAVDDGLLSVLPFQIACHYKNQQSQRDIIKTFLDNNEEIEYVVCCSDPKTETGIAREAPETRNIVGASNVTSDSDEGGSGLRVEDDEAGLAGTESDALVIIYTLIGDELTVVPNRDIGIIM